MKKRGIKSRRIYTKRLLPRLFNRLALIADALRIPGFIFLAGALTISAIYLFSRRAEAKPVLPEFSKPSYYPVCRWCGEVKKDQSLYIALTCAGYSPRVVHDVSQGLKGVFDLRKVMPGDKITLDTDDKGCVLDFTLQRKPWEKYRVFKDGEKMIGIKDTIPLTYALRAAKGEVKGTLWESMISMKVPPEAVLTFTDILSYNIDFLTETRNGQRFAILYEEYYFEGEPIAIGRVIAAHYWLSDTNYAGIFYEDPDGVKGYYTSSGKNTKKALLKTPLSYRRISSHFTNSRYHPILKIYRPHLGVDYAAPTGTPVSASGDAVVTFAGWNGGYGNYVELKHENGIITTYGHLSRFAKSIRKGARVRQGQLIGYVGTTGLSTGPHLDYRVKVGGKFVNPLKYAFPDGPPVKTQYFDDFKSKIDKYLALLDVIISPLVLEEEQSDLTSEDKIP